MLQRIWSLGVAGQGSMFLEWGCIALMTCMHTEALYDNMRTRAAQQVSIL